MAAAPKKPVMDVSKPGKSPADATARPIITGHAMMKDPMVNEEKPPMEGVTEDVPETTAAKPAEEKIAAPSASHRVIQPLESKEEDKPEEPVKDDEKEETSETTPDEPAEKETPKEEQAVADDAVVDAVLDQVGDKKQETKESEEERKRQELVDKLVEEKKYFVPINQVHARRNNRLALLVIGALLPVIVGLGLAADAGAINLGFKVPFDFIKDKQPAVAPVTTTQPTTPAAPAMKGTPDADTVKWTKVTTGNKGFTLSIPDGWEAINYKQEDRVTADTHITYTAGTPAKVTQGQSSVADVYRFDAVQLKTSSTYKYLDGDEQKQDFVSGTLKGTRYYKKYPVVATAHGYPAGSERYVFEFKTTNTITYVSYVIIHYNQYTKSTVSKDDTDQLTVVEKLVKTLQIKQ